MCAMDTKLGQSRVSFDASQRQVRKQRSFFRFLQELKEELKKVSWTTKAELQLSTKVVICAVFILGLGIYLVDLIVKSGLDLIAQVVRFIFG